jgi:predicted CoA-binding protein
MRDRPPLSELRRICAETATIAVVGASPDPSKKAHAVPAYLQAQGYRIIPVNPRRDEIFGEAAYPTLLEVPEPVDAVDVFRPAPEAAMLAEQAVAIGAKVLWLQQGIASDEAAAIATAAGMTVVMDTCMGSMHAKLGLGSDPGVGLGHVRGFASRGGVNRSDLWDALSGAGGVGASGRSDDQVGSVIPTA